MELGDLRAFVTTVDAGAMTRAAERLHVVQSAVSQSIKRLEQELGVALLERRRDGVRPTEAGAILVQHANTVLNIIARAERDMAAYRELTRGTVRLAMVPTAVPIVLAPLLRAARELAPGLRVDIEEGLTAWVIDRVRSGHADLGVVLQPLEHDELDTVVLGELELVAAVPSSHRFARRRQLRCKDLQDEDWITFPEHNPGRMWLEQASATAGFTPRVAHEVENLTQMAVFVESGAGIALVPPSSVAREVAGGTLATVHLVSPSPRTTLCMTLRRQHPSPAVRAVSDLLKQIGPHAGTIR
jgi:LysR family transcriptional regulator, transcription activator of glutamate synthase operon